MFVNLVKLLAASIGVNVSQLARQLEYKKQSSFYTVISGETIKLSVLLAICKACNCDIIITNHSTININLAEYVAGQDQERKTE